MTLHLKALNCLHRIVIKGCLLCETRGAGAGGHGDFISRIPVCHSCLAVSTLSSDFRTAVFGVNPVKGVINGISNATKDSLVSGKVRREQRPLPSWKSQILKLHYPQIVTFSHLKPGTLHWPPSVLGTLFGRKSRPADVSLAGKPSQASWFIGCQGEELVRA